MSDCLPLEASSNIERKKTTHCQILREIQVPGLLLKHSILCIKKFSTFFSFVFSSFLRFRYFFLVLDSILKLYTYNRRYSRSYLIYFLYLDGDKSTGKTKHKIPESISH